MFKERIEFVGGPEDGAAVMFNFGSWAMGQTLTIAGFGDSRHVYRIEPSRVRKGVHVLRLLKSYRAETCGGK